MGPRTWKRESKAKSCSGEAQSFTLPGARCPLWTPGEPPWEPAEKNLKESTGQPSVLFEAHLWQPLAWSALLSGGLGLLLLHLVGVHSVQEVLPALAMLHMLHTHADPLGQDLA